MLREARVEARYLPRPAVPADDGDRDGALLRRARRDRRATSRSAQFVLFNSLLLQLVWPLEALGWILNLAQRAIASAGRAFAWLDGVQPLPEPEHPAQLPDGPLDVRFEDVCFAYAGGSPVLCDLDLEIAPGEIVAVCGETGSGKSTLLNLLSRFYDPDSRQRARRRRRRCATLRNADLRTAVAARHAAARAVLGCRCATTSRRRGRRDRGGDARGLRGGRRRRVHRRPARRLRHADRRARRQPLGRPAPARRARARADLERARARARRPALGRRHRDRGADRARSLRAGRSPAAPCCSRASASRPSRLADRAVVLDDGAIVEDGRRAACCTAGGTFERLFGDEAVRVALTTPRRASPACRSTSRGQRLRMPAARARRGVHRGGAGRRLAGRARRDRQRHRARTTSAARARRRDLRRRQPRRPGCVGAFLILRPRAPRPADRAAAARAPLRPPHDALAALLLAAARGLDHLAHHERRRRALRRALRGALDARRQRAHAHRARSSRWRCSTGGSRSRRS